MDTALRRGLSLTQSAPAIRGELQLVKASRRNIVVAGEIPVIEGLQESFYQHAPDVLARFLLFDSNPHGTLERIRTGPGITSDVYANTAREFGKLATMKE